jgi:hypothetical protein
MIKYMLTEGGIKDRETGACIPIAEGNHHYHEYLEWVEEGNTPIPEQPSPYHELIDDAWAFDLPRKLKDEIAIDNEDLIQDKIRTLAVDILKAEGKLPLDFADSKIKEKVDEK